MKTHQRGYVYEASNTFYVQYFNGVPRKRVSQKLCDRDKQHYSTTCPKVKLLAQEFMLTVNKPASTVGVDCTITEYWDGVYLPFVKTSLKHSTLDGYEQIWQQHLKAHLTGKMLRAYSTADATEFLTELTKQNYGRRTVAHVKSLMSGLFKHAKATGRISTNPITGSMSLVKAKPPAETKAYTLPELMDIVNNKLTRTDARLVVCLAGLMGLRPSEIAGLSWPDVDLAGGSLRIRQAVVRGVVGTTKTDVDECLPMKEPLLSFMRSWHNECGEPTKGYVFSNTHGDPINIRDYVATVLKPAVGDGWKSLYAFRRGAASILTQLTGSPIAAAQLLRHKNISVTMTAYIKADRSALHDGSAKLESQWKQLSEKVPSKQ